MNFFKSLQSIGLKHLILEVKEDAIGEITVVITPKTTSKDSALKTLQPIFITGQAEAVDEAFFEHLNKPLEKLASVISNAEKHEKQTETASKNTDAEKKKKENIKKLQAELEKTVSGMKEPKDWVKQKDKIETQIDTLSVADPGSKYAAKILGELQANISKNKEVGVFEFLEESPADDNKQEPEVNQETESN